MKSVAYRPERTALLASSVGTALASVCALGLLWLHRELPLGWGLAAIAIAYLACRHLARVFAHLAAVVPSGAGLFAYTARAWGPQAGLIVIAPYAVLMLMLGALESIVVGTVLALAIPLPPMAIACGFLVASWALCMGGLRMGFRAQAVATTLLVVGIVAGAFMLSSQSTGAMPVVAPRAAPTLETFAAAIGQALFLFMGFELVCTHVEAQRVDRVAWALRAAPVVLAVAYAVALIGLDAAGGIGPLTGAMLALVVTLCLLSSFTSINGAFLGLARLASAMASQQVLPAQLAKVHAGSMLPRRALTAILPITLAFVAIIAAGDMQGVVLRAAAVAATCLYAVALCARGRPPFNRGESRVADCVLAVLLVVLGIGVVLDARDDTAALLGLLAACACAGAAAAWRLRTIRREIALAQTP